MSCLSHGFEYLQNEVMHSFYTILLYTAVRCCPPEKRDYWKKMHYYKKLNYTPANYRYVIKIHSSCEIEYFVETRLCKLRMILRSRVYYRLCFLIEDIGRRLPLLTLTLSYQGQQGDCRPSVRGNYKLRF